MSLPTAAFWAQLVSFGAATGLIRWVLMPNHRRLLPQTLRALQHHPVAKDVKKEPLNLFLPHSSPSSHSLGSLCRKVSRLPCTDCSWQLVAASVKRSEYHRPFRMVTTRLASFPFPADPPLSSPPPTPRQSS